MNGISELAKLFKERENKSYLGPQIGKIISPLPDIQVALGDKIILTKEHLMIASHILKDYEREFAIEGKVQLSQENAGETNTASVGDHGSHKHTVAQLNIDTGYKSTGKIKWTDSLKIDDEVILIPTVNEQQYYVIDKVVRL
ncbi:DUF2577 domain-containing protein [Wukongibacter baidiensis]|uniref:DUF2577 domain-containing protein n=1 Tax=Wukongibacter baidiensis TaxID=1723361 RepID=UPI003D7FC54A